MEEMLDYAERLTRAALRELPDGEWSFEDWIDDDGIDYRQADPRCSSRCASGATSMVVDWTGTAPQVKGAINNTLSFTQGGHLHVHPVGAAARASRTTRACSARSR